MRAPVALVAALLCVVMAHEPGARGETPGTALHAFVVLRETKEYRVPKARYDLRIDSPGDPPNAALTRGGEAYPGAIILGYPNTMDMNELVPWARDALRGQEEWFLHDALGQHVRVRNDRYKRDGKHDYFFHGLAYRPESTQWHDFDDTDIGSPIEPALPTGELHVRMVSKGMVAINPFEVSGCLALPEGHLGPAGEGVRSVAVGPHIASIFNRSEGTAR